MRSESDEDSGNVEFGLFGFDSDWSGLSSFNADLKIKKFSIKYSK